MFIIIISMLLLLLFVFQINNYCFINNKYNFTLNDNSKKAHKNTVNVYLFVCLMLLGHNMQMHKLHYLKVYISKSHKCVIIV